MNRYGGYRSLNLRKQLIKNKKAGVKMQDSLLLHDSHQKKYRSPFGAAPCFQKVAISITGSLLSLAHTVYLRVWRDHQGETLYEMTPIADKEDIFQVQVKSSEVPCLLWYYFIIETAEGVYYYGNNRKRQGGVGAISRNIPYSYQMTVYRESEIPSWYRDGVMYQIFPDRFFNGLENECIRAVKKDSVIHGRWEDDPIYIKDPSKGNVMKWDFYGGNLEGIIQKLAYLQELGISIIYLNPIFEAASNHRYDTGDYMKIDALLGTEAVFQKLCEEAEKKGIRIILDGVFSHTGSDSRYFNREENYDTIGAYQSKNSFYYPWFRFKEHPQNYDCWWGIDTMPNTNELEHSYKQFIYQNEDSVVRHWIKKGAAGWRLDVADELPAKFIKELKTALKEENEEAVLIGEVWEDASNKSSYGEKREYLLGDELDAVMNYPFRNILLDFLLRNTTGNETHASLMSLYENYPKTHFYSCMNLIGSHDRPRVLTILGEAPDPESLTETDKIKFKLSDEKRAMAIARYKMASLFQMTFPGVPSIYYGDEAGLEGFSDPLNRRTFPWGREDRELMEWTKKMVNLRNQYPTLGKGEWETWTVGHSHYGFARTMKGQETVLLAFNASDKEITIKERVSFLNASKIFDLIHEKEVSVEDRLIQITLAPRSGAVFVTISGGP